MKKHLIILVFILFSGAIVTNIHAQKTTPDFNQKLKVDPNVKTGTLSNGLKYYIRENKKPENRVEMRLVIKAGSLQETDAQQGLAHFVEHMCFNGTKNFEKNDLINFLEMMGIRFGSGLNAYTSFGETVYKLQLPTDNKGLLGKGYQVLEDWAHNVSFEPEEIDKERGVLIEEWRLGLDANDRMRKKYLPVIFKGSRYAERLPIGKVDVLKKCKHDTLIQFYRDWYRPDLMAVIIVGDIGDIGDIGAADTETKIKEHFGKLTNPAHPKKHVEYSIPDNTEPLVAIATDIEATANTVMVFYKHKHKIPKTLGDYRELLKHQLYNGMINERLKEVTQMQTAPFTRAYVRYGKFLGRSSDAYMASAVAKENMIDQSLERILIENERVKRHGFTETELNRQIMELMRRYETSLEEKDKTESRRFIREYINNYLSEDPIPGIENEMEYVMKLIRGIKLEEINELAGKWITDDNMAVLITAPEKEGVNVPDEAKVLQIIADVKTKEIEAYVDEVNDDPLMANKPEGTNIINRSSFDESYFTELVFENGVRVILKPTDFKNDEILFSAYSPGGHSLSYIDEGFYSAFFADQIVKESGVGDYTKVILDKKLKGKIVEVNPYIDDLTEGFTGKCSPKDLETLLQLVYLYFVQPKRDETAFAVWKEKTENRFKHMGSSPMMMFYDTLYKVVTRNDPRTILIPTETQLEKVNYEMVHNFYDDRFSDASDFTFFLVGNFDESKVIELLKPYLGGLPSTNRDESWMNVKPTFPEGKTEVTLEKGMEDKSMVAIVMSNVYEWDNRTNLTIDLLMKILSTKLRESMREEQSGVYGVRVMAQKEKYPETECSVIVNFGCNPDNVDQLVSTVFKEMAELRLSGPLKEDYFKAREIFIRDRETDLKKNKFWIKELESAYFNEDTPEFDLKTYKDLVQSISAEDLKEAANMIFSPESYVKVVLLPERKGKKKKVKKVKKVEEVIEVEEVKEVKEVKKVKREYKTEVERAMEEMSPEEYKTWKEKEIEKRKGKEK